MVIRFFRVFVLCSVVAVTAYAQANLPQRVVQVQWTDGTPRLNFSVKDLADDKVKRELQGGLKKRFVVIVQAYVAGSNALIATRQYECAVTYDLWDEGYLVRRSGRTKKLPNQEALLDYCLVVKKLVVASPANLERHRGKDIYFGVRGEFNPISAKRCRELVRPGPGSDGPGGLTINIVRRRICAADRVVEFRSQDVMVPK